MRALVAFGTKYGSTSGVAEAIAGELRSKGHDVDVADLHERTGVRTDAYDMIVIGSSVISGRWTKPAQAFLEASSGAMAGKKVALFVCCSDVLFPEKVEAGRKMYLDDVASANGLTPVAMGMFGGEVDFGKYGLFVRLLLTEMGAKGEFEKRGMETSKPYDFRDWEQIREWARSLA